MAAYNGTSKRVKNALVALLETVTYDAGSGAEPAFTAVLDNTTGGAADDQIAFVLPGDITNDRQSTGQSDRVLSYLIRVKLALENTPSSESNTYDRMYDLTDLVIDALDNSDQHSTLSDINGAIGTYMMQASRGDWTVVESNNGVALYCDVNVQITYSKNLY